MKTFRALRNGIMFVAGLIALTSCEESSDNIVINFGDSYNFTYDEKGSWDKVYDLNTGFFNCDFMSFSHEATATDWGGYIYYAWRGFCPSKSTDNHDYSDGDWTSNQWGAITGRGVDGAHDGYLLSFWDTAESTNTVPENPSCCIKCGNFNPEKVYITNSAWGYYAMKNGSAFNKKFEEGDKCTIHIYGMRNGHITGKIDVLLANGVEILNTWKSVDLNPLGDNIDMIYFQMSSTDSGTWGMNNPTYFCIDNFEYSMN